MGPCKGLYYVHTGLKSIWHRRENKTSAWRPTDNTAGKIQLEHSRNPLTITSSLDHLLDRCSVAINRRPPLHAIQSPESVKYCVYSDGLGRRMDGYSGLQSHEYNIITISLLYSRETANNINSSVSDTSSVEGVGVLLNRNLHTFA